MGLACWIKGHNYKYTGKGVEYYFAPRLTPLGAVIGHDCKSRPVNIHACTKCGKEKGLTYKLPSHE